MCLLLLLLLCVAIAIVVVVVFPVVSVIVGCFGNSHAQMIVNDPINGAIEKVLDMLNPKLTLK